MRSALNNHSLFGRKLGGGSRRLLFLAAFALLASAQGQAIAATPGLPTSQDALVSEVRKAIETGDFPAIERLVIWNGTSPYKRRIVSSQIRHSLGRPIQKIEIEPADMETRRDLQGIGNLKLNLPVSDLLRVTYDDADDASSVTPATVFLIGKLEGAYRIVLLNKRKPGEDAD